MSDEFDPTELDKILNEEDSNCELDNTNSNTQLQLFDEQNCNPKVNKVYEQLSNLISIGNKTLEDAQYLIRTSPDGENISAIASLLNAIKDTVKEFTKIHGQNIKHQQEKELLMLKFEGKKKMLDYKLQKQKETEQEINPATDTYAYDQREIIKSATDIIKNKT